MKRLTKTLPLTVAFLIALSQLGPLSAVHSETSSLTSLEANALECLTTVYPVDLNQYNVTLGASYTLPSAPSDTSPTQAVNYMLNSPDNNLIANFLFKNKVMYSLNLRALNGSIVTARSYANLTEAASDFLAKYQTFSGADSTPLIRVLSNFDENKETSQTLGGITLSVSHLSIPNVASATTFKWLYTSYGADIASASPVSLSFDKGKFYSFTDFRQYLNAGSAQAVSVATNYLENYSYSTVDGTKVSGLTLTPNSSNAKFSAATRDDALYPTWSVTLNLSQTYPDNVNALTVEVWGDSGEVFNCSRQATDSVPVSNPSAEPTSSTQPDASTLPTTPLNEGTPDSSPSQVPETSLPSPTNADFASSAETKSPNYFNAMIMGTAIFVIAAVIIVIIALKRR